MNFSNIKSLTIPEGSVTKIECDGKVMWSAIKPTTTLIFHIDETGYASDTNVGTFTFTTETADPQFLISSDGGICVMGFGENVSGSGGSIDTGEHIKLISAGGYCDGASTSEGGDIVYHIETVYHLTAGQTYELWAVAYM